jgi:hypothetical protein
VGAKLDKYRHRRIVIQRFSNRRSKTEHIFSLIKMVALVNFSRRREKFNSARHPTGVALMGSDMLNTAVEMTPKIDTGKVMTIASAAAQLKISRQAASQAAANGRLEAENSVCGVCDSKPVG